MNSYQPSMAQLIIPWWKPLHAHDKPPYSYATLIAHALLSSDHGQMKLHEIYAWISYQYPFYELGKKGWQNSIRHNLSLNKKRFMRIKTTKCVKGSDWRIVPGAENQFIRILTRRGGPMIRREDLGCQRKMEMHQPGQLFASFKYEPTLMPIFITVPGDYETKGKVRKPPLTRHSSPTPSLNFSSSILHDDLGIDHSDTDEGSLPATPSIDEGLVYSNAAPGLTDQNWTQNDVARLTSTSTPAFDSHTKPILLDLFDDMDYLDQFICFDV